MSLSIVYKKATMLVLHWYLHLELCRHKNKWTTKSAKKGFIKKQLAQKLYASVIS